MIDQRAEEQFVNETLEALVQLMRQEGMTRKQLAQQMNVRPIQVWRWFKGMDLRMSRVARIAGNLGYKVRLVFDESE